jgi:cytochrome c biogenesis protein CcdA
MPVVRAFAPILLAFLTNFAGFLPTLLETSPQAQFLIPMTLSLSAGLLIGMAASLILTPCVLCDFGSTPFLSSMHSSMTDSSPAVAQVSND